jgi:hypothetical protein
MKSLRTIAVSLVALTACFVGAGCAADPTSTPDEDLGDSSNSLTARSGGFFAHVTANGTGCPAGTWDAAISPDGETFTVSFSQYETMVDPGQSFSIKDCTLAIDVNSPNGLSFAVNSFYYQGYALLDQPGMTAKQTAKYYFQGNPVGAVENRSDMNGPFDNSYVFADNIGVADLVWSPCGATRRLNAQTRLILTNNAQHSGSGYLNNATIDATHKLLFNWKFSWRNC